MDINITILFNFFSPGESDKEFFFKTSFSSCENLKEKKNSVFFLLEFLTCKEKNLI